MAGRARAGVRGGLQHRRDRPSTRSASRPACWTRAPPGWTRIKNIVPPEAKLKSTDSTDPSQLSWYTTPEGSRIAEIDTQGDQTGGAVISWVIIGGADGFVVNPKQFFFQDGSFTDPGIIQGTNPTYHKVPTGVMYQFGIDYSKLSSDPNATKGSGGYVYVPGTPVAIWR